MRGYFSFFFPRFYDNNSCLFKRNHFDVLEIEFAQVTVEITLTLQMFIDAISLYERKYYFFLNKYYFIVI